jgi:hypothetical protein
VHSQSINSITASDSVVDPLLRFEICHTYGITILCGGLWRILCVVTDTETLMTLWQRSTWLSSKSHWGCQITHGKNWHPIIYSTVSARGSCSGIYRVFNHRGNNLLNKPRVARFSATALPFPASKNTGVR